MKRWGGAVSGPPTTSSEPRNLSTTRCYGNCIIQSPSSTGNGSWFIIIRPEVSISHFVDRVVCLLRTFDVHKIHKRCHSAFRPPLREDFDTFNTSISGRKAKQSRNISAGGNSPRLITLPPVKSTSISNRLPFPRGRKINREAQRRLAEVYSEGEKAICGGEKAILTFHYCISTSSLSVAYRKLTLFITPELEEQKVSAIRAALLTSDLTSKTQLKQNCVTIS